MLHSSVLITGASSGLGQTLALTLARPGRRLWLGDRCAERLNDTAARCAEKGAEVSTLLADVNDRAAMEDWVRGAAPLDLVLACAGITGGTRKPTATIAAPHEPPEQVRRIFETDLMGVLNTVLPAMEVMRNQPRRPDGLRGRICAIASVAGLVSFPGTPAYCAAKAAVDRFMIASGANARREGILLSSVVCGFLDTPMVVGNRFAMPGLTDVNTACHRILRGLGRNERRIIFPRWLVAGSRLMDLLPPRVAEACYTRQSAGAPGSMPEPDLS